MQVQKRVLRNARGITANMLFVNGRHYIKTRFFLGLLTHLPGFFIKHMESWPLLEFYHLSESGMVLTPKTDDEIATTDAYISERGMLMIAVVLRNDLKATVTPERFSIDEILSLEREIQIRVAIKQGVCLPMTSIEYKDECACLAAMIDASTKPLEILHIPVPKGEVISIPLTAALYLAQADQPAKKRRKKSRKTNSRPTLNPEAAEFCMK